MFDLFYLFIAALLVAIVAFMVRAVRLTKASIARAGREIPLSRPDVVKRVVDRMRSRDVRCPRCDQPTVGMLGTRNRYKCENDLCRFELEGPQHIPIDVDLDATPQPPSPGPRDRLGG